MRKLLKKQGITSATIVTDKLGSYSSALRELGVARRHDTGRWKNNRAKSSHQPSATRTTNEALQVTWIGAALPLSPRRCLQCVQRPAPSDLPPNPARVSRSGYAHVAPSDSRSMSYYGHGPLVCKFPINVTVPLHLTDCARFPRDARAHIHRFDFIRPFHQAHH
jgi:hypothetical protein